MNLPPVLANYPVPLQEASTSFALFEAASDVCDALVDHPDLTAHQLLDLLMRTPVDTEYQPSFTQQVDKRHSEVAMVDLIAPTIFRRVAQDTDITETFTPALADILSSD